MRKPIVILLLMATLVSCNNTSTPATEDTAKGDKAMQRSTKRGVAFSFARLDDAMLLSPAICWFYNWGPDFRITDLDTWFRMENVDFIPMAWNGGYDADRIRTYVETHGNCKYLLAYNEPNLNDQARMTPAVAAQNWPLLKALATELGLKLVSPAMNYGTLEGYHDPIKWLDEFFQLVPLSDVDAIAVHCYMSSVSALESYIDMFSKYGKPIWLTEFCAWDPVPANKEVQMNYMCEALNMLERKQEVERYSWFIPRTSSKVDSAPYMQLLTHTSPSELTEAGKIYTAFSTFDKSVWLDASRPVDASNYVGVSENNIQIRACEDTASMMIKNFTEGKWVEYQLYIPQNSRELQISYSSPVTCSIAYYIDGDIQDIAEVERSGDDLNEWRVWHIPAALPSGRHTLRILVGRGSFNMKWLKFN